MSLNFDIAETETFSKSIAHLEYKKIYEKIKNYVYPQLKLSPYFGNNIKRLKGELKDTYRYRIGDYRLFYTIDASKLLVFVLDIKRRNDAY
ncbi:MAG: type II toxin-antitoxin system RelE/ParE family toxin [Smithellaceae bacterium]